jgi:hypothetical protein
MPEHMCVAHQAQKSCDTVPLIRSSTVYGATENDLFTSCFYCTVLNTVPGNGHPGEEGESGGNVHLEVFPLLSAFRNLSTTKQIQL